MLIICCLEWVVFGKCIEDFLCGWCGVDYGICFWKRGELLIVVCIECFCEIKIEGNWVENVCRCKKMEGFFVLK